MVEKQFRLIENQKKKKSRIFVNRGKKKRSKHNENYFYDMKCIQMIPEDLKELTHIYIYIYLISFKIHPNSRKMY